MSRVKFRRSRDEVPPRTVCRSTCAGPTGHAFSQHDSFLFSCFSFVALAHIPRRGAFVMTRRQSAIASRMVDFSRICPDTSRKVRENSRA